MNNLNLLIVEDDKDALEQYEREIKAFNLGSGVKIIPKSIDNKKDALDFLRNTENTIDAAIIDLKLSVDGVDNLYSGNEVIHEVRQNLRFPVFVVTSTPQEISPEYKTENDLFKIITRGKNDSLLDDVVKIFNTGITKILKRKGEIDNYLNAIFWNHLSNSLDMWTKDDKRNPVEKESSLLRYTLLHMQEYLDEEIEKYNPIEFYITPPIKQKLYTGDVLELNNKRCILLTPACDFSQNKADYLLFVTIHNWKELDLEFSKNPLSVTKKNLLSSLVKNSKPRYHFIPKSKNIEAGFIDFQMKTTLPFETVTRLLNDEKAKRVATISSPFLKDIIERYSSYFSRQGSPDFNTDEVIESLINP
jgi:CheY-like chemotaxis protein